jgi:hypothetical protein
MDRDVAMVCRDVADGAPILCAARDDPSGPGACEWRFGCGAEGEGTDAHRLVPLEDVVRRDPTAIDIVFHRRGTALRREASGGRWHTETGPVLFPHRPSRRWPRFDPRYAPRRGEPLDAHDLRVIADVSHAGVHVVRGASTGAAPAFAFSIGLFRTFDHPEVAMFGLAPDALDAAVRRLGDRVRAGERFDEGNVVDGILDGRAVAFRRIVPRHYPSYLGYAVWYHGGARFPALQATWSDPERHFPWERWFPRELRDAQPALFEPEPA